MTRKGGIGSNAPMSAAPARILLVRGDGIGEWILTEPLIRLARATFPQADVWLLLPVGLADVTQLLGDGLEALTAPFDPRAGVVPAGHAGLAALAADLAAFAPDWVIAPSTERGWLERWVAAQCPAARRIALASPEPGPQMLAEEAEAGHAFGEKPFPEEVPGNAEAPEFEKLQSLAQAVFDAPLPGPPQLVLGAAATEAGALHLEPGKYVVCAPGGVGGAPLQAWPATHFAEVLAWLEKKHKLPAVLCGEEAEAALLEEVRRETAARGGDPHVWLGKPGEFARLARLLARARLFVGNEGPILQTAAAAGVASLGIFGGGRWPRFQPRGVGATAAVVQPLACFGCGWNCLFGDAPCLQSILPEAVREAAVTLLKAKPGETRICEVPPAEGLSAEVRTFIARQTARQRSAGPGQQIEALETRLAEAQSLTTSQAETIRRLEHETQLALREAGARLSASEEDRAAHQAVAQQQAAELEATKSRAAAAEATVRTVREQLAASEADRKDRVESLELQERELAVLRNRITQAETTLASLRAQKAKAGADPDQTAQLQELQQLGERAARAEQQYAASEADRRQLRQMADQLQRQAASLQTQVTALEEDQAQRRKLAEEQTAELARANERNSRHAAELSDMAAKFAGSEADRSVRLKKSESQAIELSAARKDVGNLRSLMTDLNDRFAATEKDLYQVRQRLTRLEGKWWMAVARLFRLWSKD